MSRSAYAVALATFSMALGACSDGVDARSPDLGEESVMYLGRVHVLVTRISIDSAAEPPFEPLRSPSDTFTSALEVAARFAYVRGFDEEFARSRADIPVLASDILRPGQCVPTDQLTVGDGSADASSQEERELVLLDAGEVTVGIGRHNISVPATLVPDLLPYMSGVEYLYMGEADPEPFVDISTSDLAVRVSAGGSQASELAEFAVDGRILAPPVLDLEGSLDNDSLRLGWSGQQESSPIIVIISTIVADEPTGLEVTCSFSDVGLARVDVGTLRMQGLDLRAAEAITVQASRLHRTTFDAGDFAGAELVVESRDSVALDLNELSSLR